LRALVIPTAKRNLTRKPCSSTTGHSRPVAAAELREAAFGCEAVVKSANAVCQVNLAGRVCDGCAAERSLAQLGSCYGLVDLRRHRSPAD